MTLAAYRHGFQTKWRMRRGSLVAVLDPIVKLEPHSHLFVENSQLSSQLTEGTICNGHILFTITIEGHSIANCVRVTNAHDSLLSTEVIGTELIRPVLVTSDLSLKLLVFLGLVRGIFGFSRSSNSAFVAIVLNPGHLFVDNALPINSSITVRFDGNLASRTDHSDHILGLDQTGHAVLVHPVLLPGQERAGPVHLPLATERVAALERTGMVRLELELIVAPASVLSHFLDGGIGLLGREGRADARLLFRRYKVIPDAHVDGIVRIVIVDEFQIGIIGIGIRVGWLFRFSFVLLFVSIVGGSMKGREGGSGTVSIVMTTTATNSNQRSARMLNERTGTVWTSREAQEEHGCRC